MSTVDTRSSASPNPNVVGESSGTEEIEMLGMDDMLRKYCGEFGAWQLRHFCLACLPWALESIHTMVMIFADRNPGWRCLEGEDGSGCNRNAQSVCELKPGSWEWVGGPRSATVAQWGLICDDKYKVGLAQSLFLLGAAIGAGILGHLSDTILGRKGSLTIVCIFNAFFACMTALSPYYWTYALLRLFSGLGIGGVGIIAFILATEPIGPTKRTLAGMCTFYFFSGGIALLSIIAYIVSFRPWRILYFASSVPSILFIFVLPFISESPRWYLVRGKLDQAMKVMRKIAKSNGKHLPDRVLLVADEELIDNHGEEINHKESNNRITGSLIDVFRSRILRPRLLLAVSIHFICSVVYYGLALNVVNLFTNLYLNVFLNAMGEMPAFIFTAVLLNKLGRKPLAVGTQLFSGLFCLVGSLLRSYRILNQVQMLCGIIGIFGMAGTYNLLLIYTMELFPTVVRNAALGCATQAVQVGAMVAPLVVVLGEGIPFALFGAFGIVGGALSAFLPETLNRPLYDTMVAMEKGENK